MLHAGVHFGHQASRWHPRMKQYIYGERSGVHIINLEETRKALETVLPSVRQMAAEGKEILFATTKPQAREIVKQGAIACGMPYLVERWVGGLLTNFPEISRLLKKYLSLKEQQSSGELEKYTKKEQLEIAKKLEKMDETLSGISALERMPDALFLPALQREVTAVAEAGRMGVPIIGICDTNANPLRAAFAIPANDDAIKAIEMIVGLVVSAIQEGKADAEKKALELEKEKMAPISMEESPII